MSAKFLLSMIFALCILRANAQYDREDFAQYTVRDGLSDNHVTCIAQDSRDFIWIGTGFGLNRFDGHEFEKYYQGKPTGFLTSSIINRLAVFRHDRLAVITKNGLQVLNTEGFSVRQYIIEDSTAFAVQLNNCRDAMEFRDGTIGAATATGFYVFDSNATLVHRHDAYSREDLGQSRLMYARQIISVDPDHALVYVQEDSQAVYHIPTKTFKEVTPKEIPWNHLAQPTIDGWRGATQISDHEYLFLTRTDSLIYVNEGLSKRIASAMPSFFKNILTWESKVFMMDDSTFFVNGGYQGFYSIHFNRSTDEIIYNPHVFLQDYKVTCFYKDREGRLWVGTTEGIFRHKSQPAFTRVFHWPVQDISRVGYSDAYRVKNKLFLSRFSRDVGLVKVDLASQKIEESYSFYGKGNAWNEVFTMQMIHPDTLWLGTNKNLLWFDVVSGHYGEVGDLVNGMGSASWSFLLPVQKDGYAWLCDYLGGNVARYHPDTRVFEVFDGSLHPLPPFVKSKNLIRDSYGDTWIGGHSLARWNHQTNTFDTMMASYGGPNKYDEDIRLLRADNEGSLWLHNVSNGLLEYKIREKEWVSYGMDHGLPSDIIHSMSKIMDHTLWMTCQNQIIRFDTETKKMEVYDHTDGIPAIKPVALNMYVDESRRELYAFYQDHVTIIPFDYRRDTTATGELLFQKLVINNTEPHFFPENSMHLDTRENNLVLHFTVVNFDDGEQYKFAYRMHANDTWNNLGDQRILNLTNLSPGTYRLEIAATGKSGIRQIRPFSFSIAPPFWNTPLFIVLCILVASVIVFLIYRMRIARVQRDANLDKLLSQTEMKALHAQMNPHFVFNSLNSIREMILNNEIREASKYLGKFAHLIRTTLDQSRQSFISLGHTIDYIHRYIEMEQIRNPDFHFRMVVDEALDRDETILPPMLIQPFIENALWHGTNGEKSELHIVVQFKKEGDQLICTIDDDGIGIDQARKNKSSKAPGHEPVSIDNIKKRIALLNRKHDIRSSIAIADKKLEDMGESGTLVSITLPLEIHEQ